MALAVILSELNLAVFASEANPNNEHVIILRKVSERSVSPNKLKNNDTFFLLTNARETATDITSELESGAKEITESGAYIVSSLNTENTITVKTGVTAELTLDNVSVITAATAQAPPIKLEAGAKLTLHLSGINTITSSVSGYAGIAVLATKAEKAILTIDGEGTLNVTSTAKAAAIGANQSTAAFENGDKTFGEVIINGGIINAHAKATAAAIGDSASCTGGGPITINDGIITAEASTAAAGIGVTGPSSRNPLKTVINGGYVKVIGESKGIGFGSKATLEVNGGSVNANITKPTVITNSDGQELIKTTLAFADGTAMANKQLTDKAMGSHLYSDEQGKVYMYVPKDCEGVTLTYTDPETNVEITYFASLDGIFGESGECKCMPENGAGVEFPEGIPSTIVVNKNDTVGKSYTLGVPTFIKSDECTDANVGHIFSSAVYSIKETTSRIKIAEDGRTLTAVYSPAEEESFTLVLTAVMNGQTYVLEKTVKVSGSDATKLDIADGNIIISSAGEGKLRITVGSTVYENIPADEMVYITQKNPEKTADRYITVNTNANVSIENLNIRRIVGDSNFGINIADGATLTLNIEGTNTFNAPKAVIGGKPTAQLIIQGTGSIESVSRGDGAGIGPLQKVTVNSGTVTARGGNTNDEGSGQLESGAGIGADKDHRACSVEVNGGKVYAYGAGNAAGIGGSGSISDNFQGGEFTLNGGLVVAQSGGTGMGVGYGGRISGDGNITIDGGSLIATLSSTVRPKNSNGEPVYLLCLALNGRKFSRDVSYHIGQASDKGTIPDENNRIRTTTDEEGKLYLYVQKAVMNMRWIRVFESLEDGSEQVFYYYTKIMENDDNSGTAVLSPATAMITSFSVLGQIGETDYSKKPEGILQVEVPQNINPNAIAATITYQGAASVPESAEAMKFTLNVDETMYVGECIIIAHDLSEKKYTINLIKKKNGEGEENEPTVLDISLGNIRITNQSVTHGNTEYLINPNGYVIVGETKENTIQLSSDALDDKLPPITFRNMTIECTSSTSYPLLINNADVDLKIEGQCTIASQNSNALRFQTLNEGARLNITSDDSSKNILNINGGSTSDAVFMASPRMSITSSGVALSIVAGGSQHAIFGQGKFYTDSDSYVRVSGKTEGEQVVKPVKKGADGEADTPLYQLAATLYGIGASEPTYECEYNEKNYYIDATPTLYLMVPDDLYEMYVQYDGKQYEGETEVKSQNQTVTLYTANFEEVIPPDETSLSYRGGSLEYLIKGTLIAGKMKVWAEDAEGQKVTESDVVLVEAAENKAVLTFPENDTNEIQVYTVYYALLDEEPVRVGTIEVRYNNSLCSISKLDIDGQVSSEFMSADGSFRIYMPFDHILTDYYTASKIVFVGKEVNPAQGRRVPFSISTNRSFRYNTYTVTSGDGSQTADYMVRIYKEVEPEFKAADFQNPVDSNESTVNITFSGSSLGVIATHAEKEENKSVHVYMDGEDTGVIAQPKAGADGKVAYTAAIVVPENLSDEQDAEHSISVKIGEWKEFTFDNKIVVKRRKRQKNDITKVEVEHQVSSKITNIDASRGTVEIVVPYDLALTEAQITNVNVQDPLTQLCFYNADDTEHKNPIYTWYTGDIDLSAPVECVSTAEDGTAKTYIITVINQPVPVVTNVEIYKQDESSHPGTAEVRVYGNYLENVQNAVSGSSTIRVGASLLQGEPTNSNIRTTVATISEDGNYYTATLTVPDNPDFENAREYEISVRLPALDSYVASDKLIIRKKESENREITAFELVDGQTAANIINIDVTDTGRIIVDVPYNTDLRSIIPKNIAHNGVQIEPPVDTPLVLGPNMQYKVTAESGKVRTYSVEIGRIGSASVTNAAAEPLPDSFADVNDISVTLEGSFVPDRGDEDPYGPKDSLSFRAVCGDETFNGGELDFSKAYGGVAIGQITLARNETFEDKVYEIIVTINRKDITAGTIRVPARKRRVIKTLTVNGTEYMPTELENGGTVEIVVPYHTDLDALETIVEIEGDDCIKGNFIKTAERAKYAAEYTVTAKDDIDRVYTVYAQREGQPTVQSVNVTQPESFNGGNVNVEIAGIFFDEIKAYAVDSDGNQVEAKIDFSAGKATAEFEIPKNTSTTSAKEYTLIFEVDGFDMDNIIFEDSSTAKIIVPRRKTQELKISLPEDLQEGETRYGKEAGEKYSDTDIVIDVPYCYTERMAAVIPKVEFDADTISPTVGEEINFISSGNKAKFTLSSVGDEDKIYTVHINYVGERPRIVGFSVDRQLTSAQIGEDTIVLQMKSGVNLKRISPEIELVGTEADYEPKGEQDFTHSVREPLIYTVTDKYGIQTEYKVTLKQSGKDDSSGGRGSSTGIMSGDKPVSGSESIIVKPYINGYDENGVLLFWPENNMTRAEAAAILAKLDDRFDANMDYYGGFSDVKPGEWWTNYINFAASKNYVNGYGDGMYYPEKPVSRAEFALLIARYIGLKATDGYSQFSDIENVPWCSGQIRALADRGIINGYSDGTFRPNDYITRAETVTLINRALNRKASGEFIDSAECPFEDIMRSYWAYGDIIGASVKYEIK